LQCIRLIADDRFKQRNGQQELVLAVVGEANVEANSGHLRQHALGLQQHFERLGPLLAPHIDDAQVRAGCSRLRIEGQNLAKIVFGFVQSATIQSVLSMLKN
jgi:hypothetical protein